MFRHLLEFDLRRTPLQALGWYLAFLLLGIPVGSAGGAIAALLSQTPVHDFASGFQVGAKGGAIANILYAVILGGVLLWPRRRDIVSVVLAVVALLLSTLLGALGALIPLAVITTRPVSVTTAREGGGA